MEIQAEISKDQYTTNIKIGDHHIIADEPLELGGKNFGPTPSEYLSSALLSCTLITLKMYLQRKNWAFENISGKINKNIDVQTSKNLFHLKIEIEANFDEPQQKRILAIAHLCPVHKALKEGNIIEVEIIYKK